MQDLETGFDSYLEHEQHIKTPQGKIIPFWRNMKNCSECYKQHQRIVEANKIVKFHNSEESREDFRHENYEISR